MGVLERKEREKQERRKIIVKAAEKIIQVKGVEGMTMDDVAVFAELGKGTIYLYFKNKVDLFHAVVCRGLQILLKDIRREVAAPASAMERMVAAGRAYYRFCLDQPLYFNAMMHMENMDFEIEARHEMSGVECCERVSDEIFSLLADLAAVGVADGTLRTEMDPRKLAVLLWAQISGVVKMVAAKSDLFEKLWGFSPEEMMELQFGLIRRALAPRPGEA